MQEFLKEWGPAVITAIAVLAIVGIVSFLKGSLQGMLQNLLDDVQKESFKIIHEDKKTEDPSNPAGSGG